MPHDPRVRRDRDRTGKTAKTLATQKKNRQAKHYAKALKGLNWLDEPITDPGLKRMKLQRLASGEIVPL